MNEPGIDLTGKLIIKVALGDDIRRILITNEDITYDELVLMMQRVYRGKLNSTDDIVIKYKDEDNDLITIFDSSDLSFAIQCSRILKITLFVNSKPEPLQTDEIKMIKTEFKHIRDRCTKILDRLDDREVSDFPSSSADITTSSNKGTIADSPMRAAAPSPRMAPPVNPAGSKEFDPLSTQRSMEDHQEKVMSSFGVTSNDRAGTPDSVSSIGSAGQRPPGQVPSQTGPQGPAQNTPQGPPQHPSQPQQPPQGTSMYTDPSPQKMPPWQQAQQNQQQNASGQPPHFPGQQQHQQQQPGYPQTSQQQGYPGQQPPTSQPQGVPQGVPNSTTGPSYGPGGFGQYGGQPQHGQFPGQQPGQPGPQGQMGHPSQQQQQPQQPGSPFYPQNPGQQPGNPRQPGPPGPGGNPYARQAHGYGSGYPRPAASYPQGYQ